MPTIPARPGTASFKLRTRTATRSTVEDTLCHLHSLSRGNRLADWPSRASPDAGFGLLAVWNGLRPRSAVPRGAHSMHGPYFQAQSCRRQRGVSYTGVQEIACLVPISPGPRRHRLPAVDPQIRRLAREPIVRPSARSACSSRTGTALRIRRYGRPQTTCLAPGRLCRPRSLHRCRRQHGRHNRRLRPNGGRRLEMTLSMDRTFCLE